MVAVTGRGGGVVFWLVWEVEEGASAPTGGVAEDESGGRALLSKPSTVMA